MRLSTGHVFLGLAAALGIAVLAAGADPVVPNSNRGYAPEQPLPFSHRLHAGELQMDCLFCHHGARKGAHAGLPETELCMACHAQVSAPFEQVVTERERAAREGGEPATLVSPALAALYRFAGWDPETRAPRADATPRPVPWVRVHNMPDFVAFDHSVHVARGLACQSCHGPVQAMERVRQELDMTMGWCIECHRSQPVAPAVGSPTPGAAADDRAHVSTDCAACHY